ncbi:MAG: glycosyltransferase family 39 protein [Gemmatimonadota bacterium]|nr:glycosyltransferase family 39 protein [Gemmatimonadota bacterium]
MLLIAAVGALLVGLAGTAFRARAAGGWAALLVLGQAASLRFIDAGPVVGYQHYRPVGTWAEDPIALAVLTIQVIAVAIGLGLKREGAWTTLRAIPRWLLVVACFVLLATAVAPSADPRQYVAELVMGGALRFVALGNVLLVALSVPGEVSSRLARRWDRSGSGSEEAHVDRTGLTLALAVTLVCALLSVFVYERHPHVPDEVAYLYHARYLAAGDLEMTAPPVTGAFELDLMRYESERWYSPVPPGWPAVLAVGARLGLAWLVNPLLAGLGVLLTYLLAWRLYDRRTAVVAAGLLAVSPWYLFMGMSFMTHMASFVFAAAATDAVLRWRKSRRLGWLICSGGLAGAVGLVRPLEAVAVGGLLGLAVLWIARRDRLFSSALAFALGAIVVSSIILPYNAHFTGSATEFPIMAYTEALYGPNANALGFGPDRGLGWTGLDPFPGHGARDVVVNTILNTHLIDVELFGWATGAWFLIVLAVGLRRPAPQDRWVLAGLAIPILLHAFYWFSGGPDFGARYWFLVILPLVLISARALNRDAVPALRAGTLVAAVALMWAASVTFIPWRSVDKYGGYRGMRPWARAIAADPSMTGALVLVRGNRHPDFASAAAYNPLDPGGREPVFAWDRDAATRDSLLAAFPDRAVWVLEGPTLTGGAPILERYQADR